MKKNIKIITLKEEKIGFFDGRDICMLSEYQDRGREKAISNEILLDSKDILDK